MPMNLGEERTELIADTLATIVNDYSKNDSIDGMIINCYVERIHNSVEMLIPIIRLSITYVNPLNIREMLKIEEQVKELGLKTNIKVLADFCDSSDYGLCGLYTMSCGEINSCSRLIDGEILFDRNDKYSYLKKKAADIKGVSKVTPITIVPSLNIPKKLKQRIYS